MSRREKLYAEPFEPERVAIIERNFPYFERLSKDDQRELLGHVRVFLDEKKFEGCGGLELTDEMKLTIAAQACLLLLHRQTDYYPGLDVILVYPHAYRATGRERAGGGVVLEHDQVRLGESHQRGIVVLSWDAVKKGAADPADGHNVVLHEFAHKLDEEDGAADGAPVLERRSSYAPWARVLGAEFEMLSEATRQNRETDIDAYGATNPAEFFAVITEEFFETPEKLAKNHPHLYEQLTEFYLQDPLARVAAPFEAPKPDDAPNVETMRAEAKVRPVTFCKLDEDPSHHENELRAGLLALGAKPCGFLGTLHGDGDSAWGFVSAVHACPDPTVTGATYHFARYGDGLAFHTMLDNGTIVATETSRVAPLSWRLSRFLPFNHPLEHFFVVSRTLGPEALYAEHRARVRRIAEREHATALARDPFVTYAACRLRATDLLALTTRDLLKLHVPVAMVMFLTVAIAVASCFPLTRGSLAVALLAGTLAVVLLSERVARFLQRRRFRSPPVPPDRLFERATQIDEKSAPKLRAALARKRR